MHRALDVIGLCRFSYQAIGGFQQVPDDPQARVRFLYDPARLEALLSGLPQVRLVRMLPRRQREAAADAIRSAISPSAGVTAQFRLDDDDGLALDYVAGLRAAYQTLIRPIHMATGQPVALDQANGIGLLRDAGAPLRLVPHITHLHPAALGLFVPRDRPTTIMDYGHHKLHHHVPVLTLAERAMFVRGLHGGNDSRAAVRPGEVLQGQNDPACILKARFGLDLARLDAVLPG